ncbi:unnamed protein product [Closterium sp. NIES-65]|nr:unnamed protein product [Closterium sp. NIES-65]
MCQPNHPEVDKEAARHALIKATTVTMEPVPVIDDNGYMCVDPPVDIRRELLDHKQNFVVLEHDIQVLTAKIEYLAISKRVTSEQLDAGVRQHLGAVAETLVPTATPRKQATDGSGQIESARTPQPRALAAVPAISPCPAPRTPVTKDGVVPADEATLAVVRHQERGHLALALRSRASTPVPAAPGNPGRAASSGRTGVMWNAAKQSCTVQLSDGERQALAGCTEESLRLLMKYRRWNRWKEWRAALEGLDDAQPPEARSRRKGRVSRVMHDVEEVEATTPATQDHPMAEEPEDPHEESVDDDVVYEPEGDGIEDEDDWEEVNHDDTAA